MTGKLASKLDAFVAVGFGLFLAWRQNVINFLYPLSAGLVVSPLVCMSFSCCLVLLMALVALRRNQASFTPTYLVAAPAALIVVSTVLSYLAAKEVGGVGVAYACSLFVGVASAFGLFAWVEMLAGVDIGTRVTTVALSLFVKPLVGIAVISLGGVAGPIPIAVLAAAVIATLFARGARSAQTEIKPLVMRPTRSSHFRLLMGALVVYAFIFGVTAGNTAAVARIDAMLVFNRGVDYCTLAMGAALFPLALVAGRRVRLATLGRLLTPVLAVLFLMHILIGGSAGGLLPWLTTAFWDIVQVFVLLVLIDLSHSGVASLSFVFPVGWAVVSFGYACGTLVGQVTGLVFGNDFAMVQTITLAMTFLAVVASSVLAAAQYPSPRDDSWLSFVPIEPPADGGEACAAGVIENGGRAGGEQASGLPGASGQPGRRQADGQGLAGAQGLDGGMTGGQGQGQGGPAAAVAPDPIAQACEVIAGKYGLSEREGEVLDLLARGNTRVSIAEKLVLSENTVRVHVKNIYAKLHIHSKQQLIDMVDKRA